MTGRWLSVACVAALLTAPWAASNADQLVLLCKVTCQDTDNRGFCLKMQQAPEFKNQFTLTLNPETGKDNLGRHVTAHLQHWTISRNETQDSMQVINTVTISGIDGEYSELFIRMTTDKRGATVNESLTRNGKCEVYDSLK